MVDNKISIIVPVYNAEKYLDRCMGSLLQQTYKNIEVILVNDGSTDDSARICRKYTNKNHNVICISLDKNGGQSVARNSGLRCATGDYIGFVDSDDWVEHDMYEYLYSIICSNNAEGAQIDYMLAKKLDDKAKILKEKCVSYYDKQILEYFMHSSTITGSYSLCRCLFKRDVIKGEFFREGKINEDIDFKYKVLSKCNKFVVSNQIKYYYFQSTGSTTTSGLKNRDFDLYDAAEELCRLTEFEEYGRIRELAKLKYARTAFTLLSKIAYFGISDLSLDKNATISKLVNEHRRNLPILLKSPMPLSRKILSVLYAFNYNISRKLVHFYKLLNN